MVSRQDQLTTPDGAHAAGDPKRRRGGPGPWIVALLVLAAVAAALWFALGGDVDVDTEGQFDVDVPAVDAEVDAPDVDVEGGDLPEVDVEGGDLPEVDVEGGDAEAEVPGAPAPDGG